VRRDRSRTELYSVSELGLVMMILPRERPGLVRLCREDCPTCGGAGKVLSQNSMMMRIDVREDPRLRRDDIRLVFQRMQKDVMVEFTA
jgi:ribonuclease G